MELEFEVMLVLLTGVAIPFFVSVFANVYVRLDKDRKISSSLSSLIFITAFTNLNLSLSTVRSSLINNLKF